MVLLRMLAFRPAQAGVQTGTQADARAVTTGSAEKNAYQQASNHAAAPKQSAAVPQESPATAQVEAPAQAPTKTISRGSNGGTQDWRQIMEGLAVSGMVKQLAANCLLLAQDGNTIRLGLGAGHKQLLSPKAEKRLQQALGEYFDASINLVVEIVTDNNHETPAQTEAREKDERQQQAERSIEEDGFVQAMKETFNAEVIPGSVRPAAEDNK